MTDFKKKLLSAALLSALSLSKPVATDDVGSSVLDSKPRTFTMYQTDTPIGGDTREIDLYGVSTDYGVSSKWGRLFPNFRIGPKADGNYTYKTGEASYDKVLDANIRRGLSIFASSHRIGDMYDSDIHAIADVRKTAKMRAVAKHWDNPGLAPLFINPHNTDGTNNAYYKIEFGSDGQYIPTVHFYDVEKNGQIVGNVGDSIDATGHELGHRFYTRINLNTYIDPSMTGSAAHEYMGDFTAMWLLLDSLDNCKSIVEQAGGDLRKMTNIVNFGEEIGDAIYSNPLRNYDKDDTVEDFDPRYGHYPLSQIMTGAVFDIFADGYAKLWDMAPSTYRSQPSMLLFDTARMFRSIFLEAAMHTPSSGSLNLKDWSDAFIAAAKDPVVRIPGVMDIDWGDLAEKEMATRKFERADWLSTKRAISGKTLADGTQIGKMCSHCSAK